MPDHISSPGGGRQRTRRRATRPPGPFILGLASLVDPNGEIVELAQSRAQRDALVTARRRLSELEKHHRQLKFDFEERAKISRDLDLLAARTRQLVIDRDRHRAALWESEDRWRFPVDEAQDLKASIVRIANAVRVFVDRMAPMSDRLAEIAERGQWSVGSIADEVSRVARNYRSVASHLREALQQLEASAAQLVTVRKGLETLDADGLDRSFPRSG